VLSPMASNDNTVTSSEDTVSDSDSDYHASKAVIDSEGNSSHKSSENARTEDELSEEPLQENTAHFVSHVLPTKRLSKRKTTSAKDNRSQKNPVSSVNLNFFVGFNC